MNFWSDVEKEYNELAGESQAGEDDSKSPELNDLILDIKKDLKKIPKSDVFPSAVNNDDDDDDGGNDEEYESDQEEGKRSLDTKSIKDKQCKVGGKLYEIGERWKDEKTGKNMMCILMNVPKDIQPLLADAEEVLQTSEWKRPSVEPQWSYTATPKPKPCPEVSSQKTTEASTDGGKNADKPQTLSQKPSEVNESSREENVKDSKSEKENEKTENKPEIIVVDPPEAKLQQNVDEENEDVEDDSGSEVEPQDNKVKVNNNSNNHQNKGVDQKEDDEENDEDSDSDMINEDDKETKKIEDEKNNIKSEAIKINNTEDSTKNDNTSNNVIEDQKPLQIKEDLSEITEKEGSTPTNNQNKSEDNASESQTEKGQPIYTKETVVVQRKLIKTEQTIETTETDKSNK